MSTETNPDPLSVQFNWQKKDNNSKVEESEGLIKLRPWFRQLILKKGGTHGKRLTKRAGGKYINKNPLKNSYEGLKIFWLSL